ncbi:phosphatidylinositol-glycan biosynthesis class X protein [Astyanax mexicanus]|uniref:Phosphatidylinositol-glycan biosynthesis class X protein n=1 Tax=Astyanax mexicanus TaxID=7994 RepID=A0A8B9HKF9_ASTMX|nr:phosphatidylinositol-glycan biosynthesis class X protein [Astyanax mexicanus]
MIILYFFLIVFCLIHCEHSQKDEVICGLASSWLESVVLSVNIDKKGFHRELLYEVKHDPTPHVIKTLLIQRLPSGVYMDQYQLASLKEDTGLEVLLDSSVNLEDPAYVSPGFSALVYLRPAERVLQAAVPIHGRYHRPSNSGGWEKVTIEGPKLLLRPEKYETKTLPADLPHRVVKAPCTVRNQSLCSWLEIQTSLVSDSVSLKLPVGNLSLAGPVCAGTVLATLLCCALLFRSVWKHGIF